MGGVVRDVFATAKNEPVHVGVFIQGTDRPIERIFAAVDSGHDGRAALDLAVRIARSNNARLHALLVANSVRQMEDEMVDIVRDVRKKLGRRFHSDVLSERSLEQLLQQSPGRLLIVGKKLADEIRLPLDEVPEGDSMRDRGPGRSHTLTAGFTLLLLGGLQSRNRAEEGARRYHRRRRNH